ncbi:MAG: hypothetical protein E7654_05695 [Ruminococcaceae bacterium]|nr:hypothetical protein [Oscillospiraceae bacterium]
MKMKKITIAILFMLLCCLLCLPAAAEETAFNPKLTIDRTAEAAGSFTVSIAVENNTILAEKQPTLRLPCTYTSVTIVLPDGTCVAGTVADGQVGFKVTMGGTYTVMNADPAKMLSGITVTTQPKLSYTEGDSLDLSAMVVTALYADGSTTPLDYTAVVASIPHGAALELAHHDTAIDISYGGRTAKTDVLIVQERPQNEAQPDYWLMVLWNRYNQKLDITATATEGGEITPAGTSTVKYGKSITYSFAPNEGYVIADVLVDGKSVGAVNEYTFKKIRREHDISVIFTPIEDPIGKEDEE